MLYLKKYLSLSVAAVMIALVIFVVAAPRVSYAQATLDKATVQKVYDTLNGAITSGDTTALEALLSPDYAEAEAPQSMSGVEYLRLSIKTIHAGLPDAKFTVDTILVDGDQAAVFATITGTNTGAMGSMAATGNALTFKSVDLLTFKDGKLSAKTSMIDTITELSQLGFTITPPTPVATPAQ